MAGRVQTVTSYENALGSLDNYLYRKVVNLDAEGNVIDYDKELEEAGQKIRLGEGWNADAPYEWYLIRDGINTTYTTGNNTQGVTDVLYGRCNITVNRLTDSTAELLISGKGLSYSDSTKDTALAIHKFPLVQAMTAYGRAFGYDMTYADADNIINDWSKDDEWKEGILPYLKYCFSSVTEGIKTFWINRRLANKLKNWLIDKGANSNMEGHEVNTSTQTTVSYSTMQATALMAYELLLSACQEAGMDLTSQAGKRVYDLYQYVRGDFQYWKNYEGVKIGSVTLSFGRGGDFDWSTYAHYDYTGYTVDEISQGNLVYPPEPIVSGQPTHTVTVLTAGTQYRNDWIGFSGLNGHGWYNTSGNSTITESISINTTAGQESGSITLSTIGVISDHKLPVQSGATLPSKNEDLTTTFPNWSKGTRVSAPIDGSITGLNNKEDLLPIVIPVTDPAIDTNPVTQEDSQEGDNTNNILQLLPFLIPVPTDSPTFDFDPDVDLDPDADVPDVDIPDPTIVPIPLIPVFSGTGHGMVNIYNPTFNQVAQLTQYLWSNNFIDNIKKIFQDPMQAIISLSVLYATPSVAENPDEIIVGTLATGVTGVNVVNNQYIDVNCGSVRVNPYYGNALDYINTRIELFLPFIGFIDLETATVMGHEVAVRYRVDVLTGICLAVVYVNYMPQYTFTGNCAVQLPISAQNYASTYIGASALIGSLASAAITKSPASAVGAVASIPAILNKPIQRGGNLGGNAGAMGYKKPILYITRNKPYNPANYNSFYGYPANTKVRLGDCTGFTRVKDVILKNMITEDGTAATMEELNEIEALLKEGVYL